MKKTAYKSNKCVCKDGCKFCVVYVYQLKKEGELIMAKMKKKPAKKVKK